MKLIGTNRLDRKGQKMIPAPDGLYAIVRADPTYFSNRYKVVAFDDEGFALIAPDDGSGRLIRAADHPDFEAINEIEPVYTAIIPADGWRVKFKFRDKPEALVGWALARNGLVVPLAADGYGEAEDSSNWDKGEFEIYHESERRKNGE